MTIRQFVVKYRVPYHIVYKASYKVHPLNDWDKKDREYNESDLLGETRKYVRRRLLELREQYGQYVESYDKLKTG